MNAADLVILLLVAGLFFLSVRRSRRRAKNGCCGSCSGCSKSCGAGSGRSV